MRVMDQDQHISPDQLEEMTATEAGKMLHVGHTRMAQLLKAGEKVGLPSRRSPLDRRVRLVKRSDVETLRQRSQGLTIGEARKQLGIGWEKMRALIEEEVLPVRQHPLYHNRRIVDPDRLTALLAERRRQGQE